MLLIRYTRYGHLQERKTVNNIKKYNQAFTESLQISEDQCNSELAYESIPQWDSVGHMELMAALEDAFDIMMDTDDIIDFSSYEKGKEILSGTYGIELQ